MTFDVSKFPKEVRDVVSDAINERNQAITEASAEIKHTIKTALLEIADAIGVGTFEQSEDLSIKLDGVKIVIAQKLDEIIKAGTIKMALGAVGIGAKTLERYLDKKGEAYDFVAPTFRRRAFDFAKRFADGDERHYQPGTKWKLSERIWDISGNNLDDIQSILKAGEGTDAVKLAKSLRKYIKEGRESFAEAYPDMMDRMEGRVAKTTSYEALRLCRTELSEAYWEGALEGYRNNDAIVGVRSILSNNRGMQKPDICDIKAGEDLYGLGKGCFPIDDSPSGVYHPNCLCTLVPVIRQIGTNTVTYR